MIVNTMRSYKHAFPSNELVRRRLRYGSTTEPEPKQVENFDCWISGFSSRLHQSCVTISSTGTGIPTGSGLLLGTPKVIKSFDLLLNENR